MTGGLRGRHVVLLGGPDDPIRLGPPPADALLVAASASAFDAAAQSVPCITLPAIVPTRARSRVSALREVLIRAWTSAGEVTEGGLDLLSVAMWRHVAALSRLAWQTVASAICLERLAPASVRAVVDLDGHGLDQPGEPPALPLLGAIMREACRARGTPFDAVPRVGFRDRAAQAAVGAGMTPVSDGAQAGLRAVFGGEAWTLVLANGPDLLRAAAWAHAVEAATRRPALLVYTAAIEAERDAARQRHDRLIAQGALFARCGADDPGSCDVDPRQSVLLRQALAGALTSASRGAGGPDLGVALATHLDFIVGPYLERVRRQVRGWQRLLAAAAPRRAIGFFPVPALDVAAAAGIPTACLPHAALCAGIGLPQAWTRAHVIGAVGPAQARRLRHGASATGAAGAVVVTSGDPTLDGSPDARALRAARAFIRAEIGAGDTDRVLLVLAASDPTGIPRAEWSALRRRDDALARLLVEDPPQHIVVRGHPRRSGHAGIVGAMEARGLRSRLVLTGGAAPAPSGREPGGAPHALAAWAAAADAVLALAPSSALLEAAAAGAPVLLLTAAMPWFDARATGLSRWPAADSVERALAVLGAWLRDDAARADGVARTRAALRGHFVPVTGSPAPPGAAGGSRDVPDERVARLLARLARVDRAAGRDRGSECPPVTAPRPKATAAGRRATHA
ncbi:MAG: hypothetical protein KF817_12395 [Phycisphaeraceae bacterium]|nr:hypothetical protein [Phycisphaeraceae bacterium]